MRIPALALVAVLASVPAGAEGLKLPTVVLIGGQASDGVFTIRGLNHGCHESNQLFGKRPTAATIAAAKGAVTVGLWSVSRWMDKTGHPKFSAGLRYLGGGVGAFAGVSNVVNCR